MKPKGLSMGGWTRGQKDEKSPYFTGLHFLFSFMKTNPLKEKTQRKIVVLKVKKGVEVQIAEIQRDRSF